MEWEFELKITELELNWKNGIDPNPVWVYAYFAMNPLIIKKNCFIDQMGTMEYPALVKKAR